MILFLAVLASSSCAAISHQTYKEKLSQVDRSDGIDKEEAVVIAQNKMIETSNDKDHRISKPIVKESKFEGTDCWFVRFNLKFEFGHIMERMLGTPWIGYYIDKTTGDIKGEDSWYPDL
jgi:hypothetical protein